MLEGDFNDMYVIGYNAGQADIIPTHTKNCFWDTRMVLLAFHILVMYNGVVTVRFDLLRVAWCHYLQSLLSLFD